MWDTDACRYLKEFRQIAFESNFESNLKVIYCWVQTIAFQCLAKYFDFDCMRADLVAFEVKPVTLMRCFIDRIDNRIFNPNIQQKFAMNAVQTMVLTKRAHMPG